ncbi:MAG: FAD:protein FMN transferase [Acidobacteriota bacterium]
MYQRREILKLATRRTVEPDAYWLHVSRAAMACRFEITLPVGEQSGVKAASAALAEAERLEQQLTVFRDSSEVSFINQNAAAQAVPVDPALFALLRHCQDLSRATEGAFDITSSTLSRCWGFLRRQGRIPTVLEIEQARSLVGGEKLCLDAETRAIRFARSGMEVNLGSIGKGYALDCMIQQLRGGVRTALLSAGSSSMRALGRGENGRGWTVGVRHPLDVGQRLAVLRLRDAAMATSGGEEQFFEHDGKRYGHIIDPRTGWPAESVAGVTVVTSSAAVADALATGFYVGGRALAERYCAAHPGTLVVMLESGAELPIIIGHNEHCEVEILNG